MLSRVLAPCFLALLLALAHSAPSNAAVFGVSQTQACSAAGIEVVLSWSNLTTSTAQYVEVSRENNGWQAGSFSTYGPLAGEIRSIPLNGLVAAATYYLRISERTITGEWQFSDTYSLITRPCSPAAGNLAYAQVVLETFESQSQLVFFLQRAVAASSATPVQPLLVAAYPNVPKNYVMRTCGGCPRPAYLLSVSKPGSVGGNGGGSGGNGGSGNNGGSGGGGEPACHPAYAVDWWDLDLVRGGCIRLGVGDYDCVSGTGDGPNWVIDVVVLVDVNNDPFDLDRDNDGTGCESDDL